MIILAYFNDIDTSLFLFLNGFYTPFLDVVFGFISSKTFWLPLFFILFPMIGIQFKWKTLYIIPFLALLFVLGDQISVKLFKDVFERLRPCHNPEIEHLVHIVSGKCGGKFGFVSSHASNSFAGAVFIGLLLRKYYRFIFPILLFWAGTVAYSRVYLGVHYPGDVLGGAILGSIIAIFVYSLLKILNARFNLKIDLKT